MIDLDFEIKWLKTNDFNAINGNFSINIHRKTLNLSMEIYS